MEITLGLLELLQPHPLSPPHQAKSNIASLGLDLTTTVSSLVIPQSLYLIR